MSTIIVTLFQGSCLHPSGIWFIGLCNLFFPTSSSSLSPLNMSINVILVPESGYATRLWSLTSFFIRWPSARHFLVPESSGSVTTRMPCCLPQIDRLCTTQLRLFEELLQASLPLNARSFTRWRHLHFLDLDCYLSVPIVTVQYLQTKSVIPLSPNSAHNPSVHRSWPAAVKSRAVNLSDDPNRALRRLSERYLWRMPIHTLSVY